MASVPNLPHRAGGPGSRRARHGRRRRGARRSSPQLLGGGPPMAVDRRPAARRRAGRASTLRAAPAEGEAEGGDDETGAGRHDARGHHSAAAGRRAASRCSRRAAGAEPRLRASAVHGRLPAASRQPRAGSIAASPAQPARASDPPQTAPSSTSDSEPAARGRAGRCGRQGCGREDRRQAGCADRTGEPRRFGECRSRAGRAGVPSRPSSSRQPQLSRRVGAKRAVAASPRRPLRAAADRPDRSGFRRAPVATQSAAGGRRRRRPRSGTSPIWSIERQLDLASDDQWLDRLARDIARAGASDEPLRFRLHPQTLGHLQVELTQSDRGATVRLTVETEAARNILADAQPRLAAEARAQGVRLADTEVDLRHRPSQQGDPRRQAEAQPQDVVRVVRATRAQFRRPSEPAAARSDRYA